MCTDMYTEWRDVYFNPEIALSPERFAMMEKLGFNHHNIHATPADGVKDVYEIDLESIKNLDQDWAEYSESLFDYADIFNTPVSLAGAPGAKMTEFLPDDRYVDGIDQVSFLLAAKGQSSMRSII